MESETQKIIEDMGLYSKDYPKRAFARFLMTGADDCLRKWTHAETHRPEFDPAEFPLSVMLILSYIASGCLSTYEAILPPRVFDELLRRVYEGAARTSATFEKDMRKKESKR